MQTKLAFLRELWSLIAPYWRSDDKWRAFLLLGAVVALNLGIVYVTVLLNKWNNDFFNSIQNLDKAAFFRSLIRFSWLAGTYIVLAVYMLYLRQMLQIRWRRWTTNRYLDSWLQDDAFYRMQLMGQVTDNPDQRISEDINSLVDSTLTLAMRLLRSAVTLVSFVVILWQLSGAITLSLGPLGRISIPGYMVWAALVYAMIGTILTMHVGGPLARLNFQQQRFEADFRFSLVRLRENSEAVAIYGGHDRERENFRRRFSDVFLNFVAIMRRQKRLTWLTAGYEQTSAIFPLVVASPRFFSGMIKLGELMQIAMAFGQVHDALSYIVTSYVEIAELRATVDRLHGFSNDIGRVQGFKTLEMVTRTVGGGSLNLDHLSLRLPDGSPLAKNISLALSPGESLLVTGPSGVGKSTLMRSLAGIWPFGDGNIRIPGGKVMFLSQKPYLPLGSLREALVYPELVEPGRGSDIKAILDLCGLNYLGDKLDVVENWAATLSPGEQQRIAFARVLLHKPDSVFLDEATSSLDEATEAKLYDALRKGLPRSIIVSVGHRSTLTAWHEYRLELQLGGDWTFHPTAEAWSRE